MLQRIAHHRENCFADADDKTTLQRRISAYSNPERLLHAKKTLLLSLNATAVD